MSQYVVIFLAGLAGSMHCVGMCGGFACALGADRRGGVATLGRHLTYNLGRVGSYAFLGACAGYFGLVLIGQGGDAIWASLTQRGLAVAAGLLMLYIGLQFLGLLGHQGRPLPGVEPLAGGLRRLLKAPGPWAPLALGSLNGLLPCPLVYAFVAHAAGTAGPLPGLLVMAVFGLGTLPAMLLSGGIGTWLRARSGRLAREARVSVPPTAGPGMLALEWRRYGVRIAGAFIVLLGLVTVARGVLSLGGHAHGMGGML